MGGGTCKDSPSLETSTSGRFSDRNNLEIEEGKPTSYNCVTVGENAVVGAMNFVNSDIPDNCVAMGMPAKVINSADCAD